MVNVVKNNSLADYYYQLLSSLNADSKLDLIARLSQSLRKNEKGKDIPLADLFGAYKSEESAEEIIAELRAARTFNRKTEIL